MTLGEKLKKARLEQGLTQSQVCGAHMTRNMLSQLENDLASPSVRTLEHLSHALGVSIGWLLEADPAQERLEKARALYREGDCKGCFFLLQEYAAHTGEEGRLLLICSALRVSEAALADGRIREAEQAAAIAAEHCAESLYAGSAELLRAHGILLRCAMERGESAEELMHKVRTDCAALQREQYLLLNARYCLLQNDPDGALRQLKAVSGPGQEQIGEWLMLQGLAYMQQGNLQEAEDELHRAESAPRLSRLQRRELYRLLEQCSREREDYRQAYFYAQRQLQLEKTEN